MAEDLVDKVLNFFTGDSSDDKMNMLKQVQKELVQNKYSKYFKMKSEEADPSLILYIFSVYKMIQPLRIFLNDEKKTLRLKQIIIEAFLDPTILETVKKLAPEAIANRSKTTAPMDLAAQIQSDIETLVRQFDAGRIATVNRCYSMIEALHRFVNFNYIGLFKKSDPHYIDGVEQKFLPVKVSAINRELTDFLAVTYPLKLEYDWNNVLNIINGCAGKDLISRSQFDLLIKGFLELHTFKIIELMIQYTLRNPVWVWSPHEPVSSIAEEWLDDKKAEAQGYIDEINNAHKNSQIAALLKQIFESGDLTRLDNYNVKQGEIYIKKELDGFYYAEGLNYLKAFLDYYLVGEIKELCDILLIRGQWTNNAMSKEMSYALNELLETGKPIMALDVAMSEDGKDGSRLRAALLRIDRDRTQARYINSINNGVNSDALDIINQAAQDFITIGKIIKNLIDDLKKKHPELLINWRELNLASKDPLLNRMVNNYKRINYFVQLMRLCTQ